MIILFGQQAARTFSLSLVSSTFQAASPKDPEEKPRLKRPLLMVSCVRNCRMPLEEHASLSSATTLLSILSFKLLTASDSRAPMLKALATAVALFQSLSEMHANTK